MAKKTDTSESTDDTPTGWRRFECPATRDGFVLLWHPDDRSRDHEARFIGGFYATDDEWQLKCLDRLAATGYMVEVPYETSRPTQPRRGQPQPRTPADIDRD